jgi:hypothetical protein
VAGGLPQEAEVGRPERANAGAAAMNESEIIVKHILEGSDDDFDPKDFVKSATNRESAVEIYNGPLVRVIQPLAAFTINNYLRGPRGLEFTRSFTSPLRRTVRSIWRSTKRTTTTW